MKISCCWLYAISKYGYPPSISDTYQALKDMQKLGFKYVELEGVRKENLKAVYKEKEKLKAFCQDVGLEVINFCPVLPDIVSLDKEKRKEAHDLFDLAIEISRFFDCKTIQLDSFSPPLEFIGEAPYKDMVNFGLKLQVQVDLNFSWNKLWDVVVETFKLANQKAKNAGLKLCLEPRVGEIISNTDAFLRLMDHINDDNFGIVLDTGHQHAQKEILPLSVEKLGKQIFYLHVSDNDGKTNKHLALGRGTIDWEGVFAAMKKFEYEGYVAIDVGRVPDLDNQYKESIEYLLKLGKKIKL
jgi:sugar phosphate isomerase/epimerase